MKLFKCYMFVLLVMMLLFPGGCGNREPQRKPAEAPVRIGFALADMERDGNKTIKKTVDKGKQKANLHITWLDARQDPVEQDRQLDELIKKKAKAVVLQPVDPTRAVAQVEKLARAGIKVVVLENLPMNTPADGYIASDHVMAGRLQARFVLEALRRADELKNGRMTPPPVGTIIRPQGQQHEQPDGAGGDGGEQTSGAVDYSVAGQLPATRPLNVVLLRGDPRDQMAAAITAACREVLNGREDVRIIGVYDHPRLDPATVPATLGQILGRGERVDVVLANDSGLAVAAVDYLKAGGYDKNVLTVGVGANEQSFRALVNGEHDAEVDVQPEMLGQFALDAAVDLAGNGHWQYNTRAVNGDYSIPARIVPVRLVTARNAYLLEQRHKGIKKDRQEQRQEGAPERQGGEGEQQAQGEQGGQGGQDQPNKTMLRITTQEGKTVEVQIDGEVKKIESMGGGQQGQDDQQGGQGQDQGNGGQ